MYSPDTPKEEWPCANPVCGSPLSDASCAAIANQCPAFLADAGSQAVMLTCAQQECDVAEEQAMHRACCPDSDTWPCETPRCDNDCLNRLASMGMTCPTTLLNADGVTETLQQCQAIQNAIGDSAQQACQDRHRDEINQMKRTCCPNGWFCADTTEIQCGQGPTECLGRLSALVTFANCTSLLLDPYIQQITTECSTRSIAALPTTTTPTAGRGGTGGRGGRGGRGGPAEGGSSAPAGRGAGLSQDGQRTTPAPSPPPPATEDEGSDWLPLVGGLVVIAVAGAAYMKTKGKSGAAREFRQTQLRYSYS